VVRWLLLARWLCRAEASFHFNPREGTSPGSAVNLTPAPHQPKPEPGRAGRCRRLVLGQGASAWTTRQSPLPLARDVPPPVFGLGSPAAGLIEKPCIKVLRSRW